MALSRRRALEISSVLAGEIRSKSYGEGSIWSGEIKAAADLTGTEKLESAEPAIAELYAPPVSWVRPSFVLGYSERNMGIVIQAADLPSCGIDFVPVVSMRGIPVGDFRKQSHQEILFFVNCINYVLEDFNWVYEFHMLKMNSSGIMSSLESFSIDPGIWGRISLIITKGRVGNQGSDDSCSVKGKGEIRGPLFWKLLIQDQLVLVKCINFVRFVAFLGERESYFSEGRNCPCCSVRSREIESFPVHLCLPSGMMQVDRVRGGEGEGELGQGSGGGMATAEGFSTPKIPSEGADHALPRSPDPKGKVEAR